MTRTTHRAVRTLILVGCLGVGAVVSTVVSSPGQDVPDAAQVRGHPGADHGSVETGPVLDGPDGPDGPSGPGRPSGRDGHDTRTDGGEADGDGAGDAPAGVAGERPAASGTAAVPAAGFDGLGAPPDLEPATTSDEGFAVAPAGLAAGSGGTVTYTVELEPAVDETLRTTVDVVEDALHDDRSWASEHRLDRVDDPEDADIRVLLATPDTVDELCAQAELDTAGSFSCWNGTFAALNATRWHRGVDAFGDDLTTYRRYLVNHEVGHGLGHAHVECPAPGELAPVMMQQSMGTGGCEPNGWVYLDGPDD